MVLKCCKNCYQKCDVISAKGKIRQWFIRKFDLILCLVDMKLRNCNKNRPNCVSFWPNNSGFVE